MFAINKLPWIKSLRICCKYEITTRLRALKLNDEAILDIVYYRIIGKVVHEYSTAYGKILLIKTTPPPFLEKDCLAINESECIFAVWLSLSSYLASGIMCADSTLSYEIDSDYVAAIEEYKTLREPIRDDELCTYDFRSLSTLLG